MGTTARAAVIVLDGCGIGALPDAAAYGDAGSNTLVNAARAAGRLTVPVLERLGLGVLAPIAGVCAVDGHEAAVGVMREVSAGKDSTTGHWELCGLVTREPFPTYPAGFPPSVVAEFERAIGRHSIGNVAASGTELIARLGAEHLRTGAPIVYTSADSVFQIAAHEDVVSVDLLYQWCRTARALLRPPHAVSRVIARPFVGAPGAFVRTDRRRDFSLSPTGRTVLDALVADGQRVHGVGKIEDLFAGRGITAAVHTKDDMDGITQTVQALSTLDRGLVFTNLVELDQTYGHRSNVAGWAAQLTAIDRRLPEVLEACGPADLAIITADHGNDPTSISTDHSREMVPVLMWRRRMPKGIRLGVRTTFADVGATVCDALGVPWSGPGVSMLPMIA